MTNDEVLALYERAVEDVYRYAMRLTGGNRAWADEVVQDTFVGLLERSRGPAAQTVDVGWLIVSCRHRFLDGIKRERRLKARQLRSAEPIDADSGSGRAVEALDELPTDQRIVLVLKYIDQLSVTEIAAEIGRSVHATESLLIRAKASLRRQLARTESKKGAQS